MAGYRRKVQQWQDAGLISVDQADAIFAWEKDKKAGKFGRGLVGVGIFAILTGVLSIIASHWESIPAMVKIGAHLILNIGVAAVAWHAVKNGRDIVREGAAMAFFLLTLTFMVLIGQVFQLDGTLTGLTATWMMATLPFILFFGRMHLSAIPWMIAFLTTVAIALFENIEKLPDFWQFWFVTAVATLLPLGLIADGNLKIFQRLKPAYADTFTRSGFALMAIIASGASFFWYAPRSRELADNALASGLSYTEGYMCLSVIFIAALIGIALRAMFARFFTDDPARRFGTLFCVVSTLMIALPLLIPGGESNIAGAIFYIAYWIFIGWLGQQLAWSRLISLAIVLVTLRIFSIYIEVFGTLMDTGIGLVVGGAVLLGLIALARRMNKRLTGKEVLHG